MARKKQRRAKRQRTKSRKQKKISDPSVSAQPPLAALVPFLENSPVPLPPKRLFLDPSDNDAVYLLSSVQFGELPFDRFAPDPSKDDGKPSDDAIAKLRLALIKIYSDSADEMAVRKATHSQLRLARVASRYLQGALENLANLKAEQDHLAVRLGAAPSVTPFVSGCLTVSKELEEPARELGQLVQTEIQKAKPSREGRLMILLRRLKDWWDQNVGSSTAPSVTKIKEGDKRKPVAWDGPFLRFARALFCQFDTADNDDSRVVSAVLNLHKNQEPRGK